MSEEPQGQTPPAGQQGGEPQGQTSSGQPPKGEPEGENLITLSNGQRVAPEKLAKMWDDTQAEIKRLQAKKEEPAEPNQEDNERLKEAQDLVDILAPVLEKAGFAKKDEVTALQKDQKLDKLIGRNPDLAKHKDLLKDLSRNNPKMSYEDLIAKYKLGKVQDATQPSGDVLGEPNRTITGDDNIDLNDVSRTEEQLGKIETEEDLNKFREKAGIGQKKRFVKRRTV
jgi:hypothetical protein